MALTERRRKSFERQLADLKNLKSTVEKMMKDGTLGGNGRADFERGIDADIKDLEEILEEDDKSRKE